LGLTVTAQAVAPSLRGKTAWMGIFKQIASEATDFRQIDLTTG